MMNGMLDHIIIRTESPTDYRETENMVRQALWDLSKPGCDKHLIIHDLRDSPVLLESSTSWPATATRSWG